MRTPHLQKLAEARDSGDLGNVNKLEKDLAFNLGGHVNHSIFWTNLSPDGGDKPTGELASAIDDGFGSFDKFVAHFTAAATGIQGSGWAVLSWDPLGKQLIIQQLFDQQANSAMGTIPVLQLDMWEHAFYLDYLNVKADYVKAFWNIANWENAGTALHDRAREDRGPAANFVIGIAAGDSDAPAVPLSTTPFPALPPRPRKENLCLSRSGSTASAGSVATTSAPPSPRAATSTSSP